MKKLFRKIFIYLPLFLILTIGLIYFIITSGFFLKFIGLPLAGTLIGMPIKVEKIDVSFLIDSHLDVSGLSFGYSKKPFITGKKISTRFDLLSLLKGDLKLANVSIDGLDINMTSDKNGKWNVYWMNESPSPEALNSTNSERQKSNSSSGMQLDIAGASIQNVNFTLGIEDDIKIVLKKFSICSDSFKNRQESNVKIKGDIEHFTGKNVKINNGEFDATLKTNLNEDYFPTFLQLDSVISNFTGVVKDKTLSNRSFKINALLSPDDKNEISISNISVKEYVGTALYSSLVAKGKINLTPLTFDLNINADPVGSDTINLLANSFLHTDLGDDANLVFKGDLSLVNDLFTAKGDLKLADLLLQSPVSSTKKELVSAIFKYNIATNFSSKKTDMAQLQMLVDRNGAAIIDMSLKKPVSIAWGNNQIKVTGEDPEIVAKISDLKLVVFNDFLSSGAEFSSGVLNSNLNLKLGENGADISMFGNINLSNVSYLSSGYKIKGVSLNQAVNLTLNGKKYLNLKKCCIDLSQNGQKLLKSSLSGKYNLESGDGEVKMLIPSYSLAIINVLPDSVLSKHDKKQLISTLSPFDFAISNSQAFNVKGTTLTVKDFLLSLQTEKKGEISLTLDKNLKLALGDAQPISETLPLRIKASNFELKNLNGFFTPETEFQKGVLNISANAVAEKDFSKISASGNVIASDICGSVNGNVLNNVGVNAGINVVYNNANGSLTLTDTVAKVLYGNNDAANISVNGTITNDGTASFESKIKANEYLLKTLNETGSDCEKIETFLLDGSLKLKTTKDIFSIDGNVNIPKLIIVNSQQPAQTEQINGTLDVSIHKNPECVDINSAKLNLYNNGVNICDLTSNGRILFSDTVQSNLSVSSEKIDLEKIVHIYDLLFPPSQVSDKVVNQTQTKEPAPIDLRGINLKCNINLKDIQYGSFIHTSVDSSLIIKNNIIAILPLVIRMNKGELKADIHIDPAFADGYKYDIKSKLQNIEINPLLKTFIEGDFRDTKGIISSLQFNAKGKGLTSPNLLNNLNGDLSAACNNISLPLDMSKNKFLALFLMPIELISNISQKLPNTPLPSDLNQAMNLAVSVMAQRKNINFLTGDIALNMKGGVINIEKFYFVGGADDIIKTIKFGGKIGPDGKINLKTNTNFGKLDIPLDFYGTVESPKPDIPAFIAGFITKNAINILDVTQKILNNVPAPQGSEESGLGDAILNTAKTILVPQETTNKSPPPQGKGAPNLGDAIFGTAKDILSNLTSP